MDAGTRVFILDYIEHSLSALATALRSTTQQTVNNTPLELGGLLGLEDEFKQILTFYSKPIEPIRLFECLLLLPNSTTGQSSASSAPPTSYHSGGGGNNPSNSLEDTTTAAYTPPDFIPPRALPLLHDLAQQMVQAGYQQQLLQIYRETRASVLEVSLQNLGIERLGTDDVQNMQGEVLEAKIGNWIKLMRIAVKTLFAGERKICDSIFEGIDSLRNLCFVKVTVNSVHMLFSFGAAIAVNKTSPENLFVLLDMYEIMRELQPEIESVYEGEACTEMRDLALSFTECLAKTAQETFGDFEVVVEKHARKTAVLDGTVHPLTSYVINYLKFLFDYQSKLTQRFGEFGTWESTNQLETVTIRIMSTLQTNLDGESRQYKDPALTQLFLMNNIHYMVKYARRSEVMDFLGDDWVQIHERIVQQHANQYKRVAWEKILQSLSAEGLGSSGGSGSMGGEGGSSSGVSRAMVKDKFKAFNLQFEELHLRQSQWTVPDSVLRESLRLDFAEVLLPAYRYFIKRFGPLVENAKNPQKYIKYTPEDLDRMLGEFFEGKTWNEPKRQRVCE